MATEQVTSVIESWKRRAPLAIKAGVPSGYVARIAREDIEKTMQGGSPLTAQQAGATFRSIVSGQGEVQQKESHGFWDIPGNVLGDVKDIATGFIPGIAHMVTGAPKQVVDLGLILGGEAGISDKRPDIRKQYGMSEKSDWNPIHALQNVAKMPIMQYVPGLNTAANLTSAEGREKIMENPLITALDVLPATKVASKAVAAELGINAAADLAKVEAAAKASAIDDVIGKIETKKSVNLDDIVKLPSEGLDEIMRHATDPTTPIQVPSKVAQRVLKEIEQRKTNPAREPNFTPSRSITEEITTPEMIPARGDILKVLKKAPKAGVRELSQKALDAAIRHVEFALPKGPGLQRLLSPDAIIFGVRGADDAVEGFARIEGVLEGKPKIELLHTLPGGKGKGIASQILADIEKSGFDVKELIKNSEFSPEGRSFFERYLGEKPSGNLTTKTVDRLVPLEAAAKGSTAEALALGQPIKALSRATGLSERVIAPLAERLGTNEAMTALYKAVGGTLPRKYQPQLEEQLRIIGDQLSEQMDLLPPEKQATFYKDVMEAAMESADTIKAADLDPSVLAGVNILRQSTDNLATQLVNAGEVVAVPLREGGTALFNKTNPVVRAWQKIEAHMQRKPENWSKNSVVDQHVRWTNKAAKLSAEYERALNSNAPLAFQRVIEEKILNQLALKMMAPEMAVETAMRASGVVEKLKAGKYVNNGDIASMSMTTLEYLKNLAEDSSNGVKVPSRVYTQIMKEINLRNKTGNMGPIDLMSPQLVEQITQKIRTGDYLEYMTKDQLEKTISDATGYWRKLKQQGYDPIPVPYVGKGADITKETFIQPVPEGMSITDLNRFRSAVFDFTPYQDDLSIALTREAVEQLRYDATRDFHQNYVGKLARDPEEVLNEYARLHPEHSRPALREEILKDYVPYDASADHPFRAEWKQGVNDSGAQLLPKPVAIQLKNLVKRDKLPVNGVFNRVNKTFRFAVLTSPRHVSHIAGGGLTQMLMRDPMAIGQIIEGIRMVKENRMPIDLPQGIDGFTTNEIWNYTAGRTIGRLAREGYVKFRKVEEFAANALKSTDYLYNKKSALRQGMSESYAHKAGIEAAGKALAVFEDMSPFERQYLRTVMPFYGFTRHLTKYLLSYPGDHPYKAAILSNIVDKEFEDWNTGFPRKWNQLFFIGKPDEEGDTWGIDFKSLNPFRTVYNNFTLAGILSQSTPWIGAPMAFMGVNTVTGSGELYPDLAYDPNTGSLVTKRQSGFKKIVGAFVPQINTVDHFFQFSADMRNLAKNNPEAYRQQLFSSLGIPFEPVKVNIPTQISRTQKNQLRVAQQAVDDALAGNGSTKAVRKFTKVPFRGQLLDGDMVADYIDNLQNLINTNPNLKELGIVPKVINPRTR